MEPKTKASSPVTLVLLGLLLLVFGIYLNLIEYIPGMVIVLVISMVLLLAGISRIFARE